MFGRGDQASQWDLRIARRCHVACSTIPKLAQTPRSVVQVNLAVPVNVARWLAAACAVVDPECLVQVAGMVAVAQWEGVLRSHKLPRRSEARISES